MFKFKKNDMVKIVSKDFFGSGLTQTLPDSYKVVESRDTLGYPQYRLKGMTGWWHESLLQEIEPQELKDTQAEWLYSLVDPVYRCSVCGYCALNDYRGRSTASKFCPHCGKYMTNHQQPEDDE